MGLTRVKVRIKKDKRSPEFVDEEFLVDSGAAYSVAPSTLLNKLGIEADEERTFRLANGDKITRPVGHAWLEHNGQAGFSKVIFGEPDDSTLLGVLALEALGLILDPVNHELKPLPMLLM